MHKIKVNYNKKLLNINVSSFYHAYKAYLLGTHTRSNWNLECWFLKREENWRTQQKTLRAGRRTNKKLNPHEARLQIIFVYKQVICQARDKF